MRRPPRCRCRRSPRAGPRAPPSRTAPIRVPIEPKRRPEAADQPRQRDRVRALRENADHRSPSTTRHAHVRRSERVLRLPLHGAERRRHFPLLAERAAHEVEQLADHLVRHLAVDRLVEAEAMRRAEHGSGRGRGLIAQRGGDARDVVGRDPRAGGDLLDVRQRVARRARQHPFLPLGRAVEDERQLLLRVATLAHRRCGRALRELITVGA